MGEPQRIQARISPERRRLHEARGEWPHPNLSEVLARRVAESPDEVLYVAGEERVTAPELSHRVARLATGLRRLGVRPGAVVSWQLGNWIEGVVLHFAIDRLGAVSNPILPIYREREVSFIVGQARSQVLVVPGELRGYDHRALAATVQREQPHLEYVLVARAAPAEGQGSFDALLETPHDPALPASTIGPDDVCGVFYTSGTTADPKGVMHTPSTLGAFMRTQSSISGDSGRIGLLSFPLTHIGGVCAFGTGPVVNGSRAIFLDPFDPEVGLDLIEREGITSAGGPTPVLQALLGAKGFSSERVRSVELAGLGATDVPPELIREVGEKLGAFVYRAYGMTECPMATSGRPDDPEDRRILTDGRAAPGVIARIADEQGRPVPPGTEGEVELFGPQLCVGYFDARLDEGSFTEDGFIRTGDLAVMDEGGYVRITGRKKDIIIRKGENLSAKAIEDELHEHPSIHEAAVIGVPDAKTGERACACVVLRPGASPLSLDELRSFMRGRDVMAQKIPEQIEIVDALPRNATGKVKKHELRERFGRRAGASA
ncbi:MAG: AMP-binding protein [Deltaproteobacteria bacterium]|nr:AMP-binding protein [Deltaproteobacteria bacterium]